MSPYGIKSAIKFLEGARQKLRDMRDEFTQRRDEWLSNADVSEVYRKTKLDELAEEFADELKAFDEDLQDAHATLLEPPPPDKRPAAERLLDDQQELRAWTRAERLLSTGSSPIDMVRQAEAQSDVTTLRALRAELPSWAAASARPGSTIEERQAAFGQIKQLIDVSLSRTLPDTRERLALRGRLLWEALAPIVEQEQGFTLSEVQGTRRMSGLQNAIAIAYLTDQAAPVLEAVAEGASPRPAPTMTSAMSGGRE